MYKFIFLQHSCLWYCLYLGLIKYHIIKFLTYFIQSLKQVPYIPIMLIFHTIIVNTYTLLLLVYNFKYYQKTQLHLNCITIYIYQNKTKNILTHTLANKLHSKNQNIKYLCYINIYISYNINYIYYSNISNYHLYQLVIVYKYLKINRNSEMESIIILYNNG